MRGGLRYRRQVFWNPQVILFSEDVERLVAFYGTLGFHETMRMVTDAEAVHVDLVLDGYRLGICSVASALVDHGITRHDEGGRHTAVVLWTDNTLAAYDRLVRQGVTPLAAPRMWLDRFFLAWLADPDGNPIQVVQSVGPRLPL